METKQKLKVGDKIVCIRKYNKDLTIDNAYKIIEINNDYFWFYDDEVDYIPCKLENFNAFFKLKKEEETETAYKETEGKLHYELDFEFITQMAERMASNKGKYEPYNWQKLDNIADLKQSLFRHVLEIMNGNYEDDNRKFGHLEAVAINAMFINYQLKRNEVSPRDIFKGILNEFKEQPFNPKEEYKVGDKFISERNNVVREILGITVDEVIFKYVFAVERMPKYIFKNRIKSGELKIVK